jgi:hypothetical protein
MAQPVPVVHETNDVSAYAPRKARAFGRAIS